MKKIYLFVLCTSLVALVSKQVKADTITVMVTNNAFSPTTFSAEVGDVVKWVWDSNGMAHNVTSASQTIPNGAAPLASGNLTSGTYIYNITVEGNYGYACTLHTLSGMAAGFQVDAANGISKPNVSVSLGIFPNPFKEKVTVKYTGVESIQVVNVLGEKVKTVELSATENKTDVYFDGLPSGIYFFRFLQEGNIVETRRIIKSE